MVETVKLTREQYRLELSRMLARNGIAGVLNRDYAEVANMCCDLERPIANCASLVMRLEAARRA